MKLTRRTVEINTNLIKVGEIIELENMLSCDKFRCLVTSVDKEKICIVKINNRAESLTIKAEELDKYAFKYLGLSYAKDKEIQNEPKTNSIKKEVEIPKSPNIDKLIMDLLAQAEKGNKH